MFLRTLAAVVVVAAGLATGGAQALVPADPLVTAWTYGAVNLPAAWDVTTGSKEVVVAVVDSGVDSSHPDLAGGVDAGYAFVDLDSDASDVNGHGTAVAGIAAARADNGLGAAGACWSCRILPLRVLSPEGFARNTTMALAIDYAVEHGAAVVNISLYGENRNGFLQDAIRRARAAGVLVIAAAGNEGGTTLEYPAAYPETLSVGATAESGELASYSSRGSWVKLAAPGCTPTTQLGGGFGAGCGTSGASPLVAGIAGLLRARAPSATAAQIETALTLTARPVGGVRFGRVDAFAALERLGEPSPVLEPTIEGIPEPGEMLTAYSGIWIGAGLQLAYRWEGCRDDGCEAVGGERSYLVRRGDGGARLRVALSAAGIGTTISPLTATVPEPPRNESAPSISGRPAVAATLTGESGSWSGTSLTFEYRWVRCRDAACTRGATVARGRTYRVRKADRGRRVKLTVTAANSLGRASASSIPTRRVR